MSPTSHCKPLPPPATEMGQSNLRRYALLAVFSLAQFLDTFNNAALFPAVPAIAADLGIKSNETAWLFAAYQATFAAFLLISGRISDIYKPKPSFIIGSCILGCASLGSGFVRNKILLLVLRGVAGVGGALTIPSALHLIVQIFPDSREQGRAIAIFGGTGAIGNVSGLLIGGVFVQYTSWHWIFWFVALAALPIAILSFFLIPTQPRNEAMHHAKLDVVGVGLITSSVILFIFALTSGGGDHWGSPAVITTLVISVLAAAVFFFWEARVDKGHAALPPHIWFIPNFSVLAAVALLPYFYWFTLFVVYSPLWQDVYGWSTIGTALRFLPIGALSFLITPLAGTLPRFTHPKYVILAGLALTAAATIPLPFVTRSTQYWSLIFPSFCVGTIGATLAFSNTNIAIFQATPPEMAGTVGAILNAALQLGSAVGISIVMSIQTNVDAKKGMTMSKEGRAAAWWFVIAVVGVLFVAVLVFFKIEREEVGVVDDAECGTCVEPGERSDTKSVSEGCGVTV